MNQKHISILLTLMIIGLSIFRTFGQSTNDNTGNTQILPSNFLGWNTTGGANPLIIKTEQAQAINIHTNTGAAGTGNLRVQVTAAGLVGIGTASIPPSCQLDVMNAININTATFTAATTESGWEI